MLIQKTVRTQFSECTVLTIAHRLETVADYDRIAVMDSGLLVACGSPRELLEQRQPIFTELVRNAGPHVRTKMMSPRAKVMSLVHAEDLVNINEEAPVFGDTCVVIHS